MFSIPTKEETINLVDKYVHLYAINIPFIVSGGVYVHAYEVLKYSVPDALLNSYAQFFVTAVGTALGRFIGVRSAIAASNAFNANPDSKRVAAIAFAFAGAVVGGGLSEYYVGTRYFSGEVFYHHQPAGPETPAQSRTFKAQIRGKTINIKFG